MDAPLAVYPLVTHQRSSLFTAAVNHLLQHVIFGSKRAVSYLHATTHLQQHRAVALQPGDTWGSVVEQMGIKDTQLLMYVKPVDDPKEFCGDDVEGELSDPQCAKGNVCCTRPVATSFAMFAYMILARIRLTHFQAPCRQQLR